jgi:predicted signal transduction protein with EAL and GGDEF domain
MYRAKRTGGGYQFFSAEMTRGATERLALEQALHHAGVEKAAQAAVLVGQGCDAAQGRHFAEPCTMNDLF